jgi:hypothetical protein
MRLTRVEEPKKPSEDHTGFLVVLGPGDGTGTNIPALLC